VALELDRKRRQARIDEVPFWWHSIAVGSGVVTPGHKSPAALAAELAMLDLPDLDGRSVLDIGGWDGFFAFEAEQRGAGSVAVLDHYMWAMDVPAQQAYWRQCAAEGRSPKPYHETDLWHPDTLPGKRGFDVARELIGSNVRPMVLDFMDCDLERVGRWDVTLYLGVLYHMEDPIRALRRLAAVTEEVAVIETEAVAIPGYEHEATWRFFPGSELNNDISNWWAPNIAALVGALPAVGFRKAEVKLGPSRELVDAEIGCPGHYRAVVHAHK
jgi:tRNA (mo5U34)-methyltransferase